MLRGYVVGADEVEDGDSKPVAIQATIRFYFDDHETRDDLREITGAVGQGIVGIHIEDGAGRPVLELVPKKERRRVRDKKDPLVGD